jgi:hypothetical protein
MTFTVADIAAIQKACQSVIDVTIHEASINDCLDNPEYLASEIVALVEWCSMSIAHNGAVAKLVLDSYPWPMGVSVEVKAQFNLPY